MKRMTRFKTTLAAAIASALLATLAGCGGGHPDYDHHFDSVHLDDHRDDHPDVRADNH